MLIGRLTERRARLISRTPSIRRPIAPADKVIVLLADAVLRHGHWRKGGHRFQLLPLGEEKGSLAQAALYIFAIRSTDILLI
uniref:Uncharacterized protein n=1 Tax=Oryza punctata TaxID=4537 RepID=A0A0E0JHW6_ORYPU